MRHLMRTVSLMMALALGLAGTVTAAQYEEGKHYDRLAAAQSTDTGDKVEVLEFFWYGCPHCYSFEPHIKKWKDNKPANVEFIRVPATFFPNWTLHARAYYALEMMGELEKVHGRFFNEIHNNKKRLKSIDEIADFVSANGVNRSDFIDSMNSFAVETKIRKATNLVKDYKISGVPAIAVNGKYLVSGKLAGSYDNMIRIMQYLIEKESVKAAVGSQASAVSR